MLQNLGIYWNFYFFIQDVDKIIKKSEKEFLLITITFLALSDELEGDMIEEILLIVPNKYMEFSKMFSKIKIKKLLLYKPGVNHKIILQSGIILLFSSIYNLLKTELKTLEKYIEKILKLGFICLTKSETKAFILFVKKKKRIMKHRFCVDYREINIIIIPNRYPIPLILEILNKLGKAIIFTKLDLKSVYNLLHIYQRDEWKTAFYC